MDRNWSDIGISWAAEKVHKKSASGNTKVEMSGLAQIPVVTDLGKVIEHFGNDTIIGSLNGTSWRVSAQDVARRTLPGKPTVEALREAVYNRLRSIRNAAATVTVEVKIYTLPDGTQYTGTDLVEYQQAFVAALSAMGVANEVAISMAQKLAL